MRAIYTMRLKFCVLCGCGDQTSLEHHHLIPKVLGGKDNDLDVITLCGECHGRVHGYLRPMNLSTLIKEGQKKKLLESYSLAIIRNHLARRAEVKAMRFIQQRQVKRYVPETKCEPLISSIPIRRAPIIDTSVVPRRKIRTYTPRNLQPKSVEVSIENFEREKKRNPMYESLDLSSISIVPDTQYPNLYRLKGTNWIDKDVKNLTRAKYWMKRLRHKE